MCVYSIWLCFMTNQFSVQHSYPPTDNWTSRIEYEWLNKCIFFQEGLFPISCSTSTSPLNTCNDTLLKCESGKKWGKKRIIPPVSFIKKKVRAHSMWESILKARFAWDRIMRARLLFKTGAMTTADHCCWGTTTELFWENMIKVKIQILYVTEIYGIPYIFWLIVCWLHSPFRDGNRPRCSIALFEFLFA